MKLVSKYYNKKVIYDGIMFDSIKEKNRYIELKLMERAGLIKNLKLQYEFELQPAFTLKNKKIRKISYIADFYYFDNKLNDYVVEDTKGMRTEVYKIKKKMFEYRYKKEIKEI